MYSWTRLWRRRASFSSHLRSDCTESVAQDQALLGYVGGRQLRRDDSRMTAGSQWESAVTKPYEPMAADQNAEDWCWNEWCCSFLKQLQVWATGMGSAKAWNSWNLQLLSPWWYGGERRLLVKEALTFLHFPSDYFPSTTDFWGNAKKPNPHGMVIAAPLSVAIHQLLNVSPGTPHRYPVPWYPD